MHDEGFNAAEQPLPAFCNTSLLNLRRLPEPSICVRPSLLPVYQSVLKQRVPLIKDSAEPVRGAACLLLFSYNELFLTEEYNLLCTAPIPLTV